MKSDRDPSSAKSVVSQRAETKQFVEFQIDSQRYAFRIGQIREIVILHNVTPTPQVAAYVDGVTNLRGLIIPVINLRVLFGLSRRKVDEETRTIVVNVGERTMGCTVDTVTRVLRIGDDQIQPAPETVTADGAHYIDGFAKVDDQLVILLDVERLLDVDRLRQTKSVSLPRIAPNGL